MKIILIYFLIVHITCGFVIGSGVLCPKFCKCDMWFELKRASCTSEHLYSIDTGVSELVEALDLSDNAISSIENFGLSNAGLVNLKYLNLSGNSISEINLHAFSGLAKLAVLDLSRNHMYYLLMDTFLDSPGLKVLALSQNHFNSNLPYLRSTSLTDLNLSSCQIYHVPRNLFLGLVNLRYLDLSNNLVIQLTSQVFKPLTLLRSIAINGNPLSCNEETFDLQIYLRRRKIAFTPVCKPKMSEKIISAISPTPNNDRSPISESIASWGNVTELPSITQAKPNATSPPAKQDTRVWKTPSPVLIFCMGFILGSGISMVGSLFWFARIKSRSSPFNRRRGGTASTENTSQVVSLLENSNRNVVVAPGTPPPSYREIMLHKNLYPSAPSATLLSSTRTNH